MSNRTWTHYSKQHPHLNPDHIPVAVALRPRNTTRNLLEIVAGAAFSFAAVYGLMVGGWWLLQAGLLVKALACFVALGFATLLCVAACMRSSQTQDYIDHP
jgi:transcriptional regulator GlxA family with amidase domain